MVDATVPLLARRRRADGFLVLHRASLALETIFQVALPYLLPLHVRRVIGTAPTQRHYMIDNPSVTSTTCLSRRGTRKHLPKRPHLRGVSRMRDGCDKKRCTQ